MFGQEIGNQTQNIWSASLLPILSFQLHTVYRIICATPFATELLANK